MANQFASGKVAIARILVLALLSGVLLACSKSTQEKTANYEGDLGSFILARVQRYGGIPKDTNNLPEIRTKWRTQLLTESDSEYLKDGEEQLDIYLPDAEFERVRKFITQAFGPVSSNWAPQVVYERQQMGVALSVDHNGRETRIIMNGTPKTK